MKDIKQIKNEAAEVWEEFKRRIADEIPGTRIEAINRANDYGFRRTFQANVMMGDQVVAMIYMEARSNVWARHAVYQPAITGPYVEKPANHSRWRGDAIRTYKSVDTMMKRITQGNWIRGQNPDERIAQERTVILGELRTHRTVRHITDEFRRLQSELRTSDIVFFGSGGVRQQAHACRKRLIELRPSAQALRDMMIRKLNAVDTTGATVDLEDNQRAVDRCFPTGYFT
jgi:hypothetical protein